MTELNNIEELLENKYNEIRAAQPFRSCYDYEEALQDYAYDELGVYNYNIEQYIAELTGTADEDEEEAED